MPSELDECGPVHTAPTSAEGSLGGYMDELRAAGSTAFAYHDRHAEVADLAFDSVVDTPDGELDEVRRLRFVASDCTIDVEVRGLRRRTADVHVTPTGDAAVAVVQVQSICTGAPTVWSPGHALPEERLALTGFTVHWTDPERRAVRTAWVAM